MIGYYAVVGLACLDDEFCDELKKNKDDIRSIAETVNKYGIHLSLYELGEVQRLMHIPSIVRSMNTIYRVSWDRLFPCLTAMTVDDKYAHPTFFAEVGGKSEKVIFARDADERKVAAETLANANAIIDAKEKQAAIKLAAAKKKPAAAKKAAKKKPAPTKKAAKKK